MIRRSLSLVATALMGYACMVLLIFVAQDLLFGGISYYDSPLYALAIGGILTALSAVVGGAIASRFFGRPGYPPALLMCCLVSLETTYLIRTGRLEGPLWFDVAAGASLVIGILAGVFIVRRYFTPMAIAHAS